MRLVQLPKAPSGHCVVDADSVYSIVDLTGSQCECGENEKSELHTTQYIWSYALSVTAAEALALIEEAKQTEHPAAGGIKCRAMSRLGHF